ncbi:(2Fe-2S)-binding protein [Roseomonas sp. E05]|uniref:(2Fe-2S)-binding protein n=1 Tax=Roseomonas sp. E05 TaxID=3046310 RepID=UPI0024BAB2CD|nr:(2Fe-2S)-binding protein [Roseomonas sp. E05]MDJ0389063.1 (2Fe-2S)-binding protein [Roseomonas sp. E05]
MNPAPPPLLRRLGEAHRRPVAFTLDGQPATALEGDTLLTAILTNASALRLSEFGDGPRAGFCLMGACQDCWVWTEAGTRLRACGTPVTAGLRIMTKEAPWPSLG